MILFIVDFLIFHRFYVICNFLGGGFSLQESNNIIQMKNEFKKHIYDECNVINLMINVEMFDMNYIING